MKKQATISLNPWIYPKCYAATVNPGDTFGGVNFHEFPGTALYCQIRNFGSSDVKVRLNDDPEAVFTVPAGNIQIFDKNDLYITSVDFAAGYGGTVPVEVVAGVLA